MKTDAIIYVEVPHRTDSQVYTFENKQEFHDFLRSQAPDGFSFEKFTRKEFEESKSEQNTGHEIGSEWWVKWVKPGLDLFDQGAETIAEVWTNECSNRFLSNPTDRDEFDALFSAVDDFHTHYYLDHDETVATLKRGKTFHTHQGMRTFTKIEQAADDLGWWHSEEAPE